MFFMFSAPKAFLLCTFVMLCAATRLFAEEAVQKQLSPGTTIYYLDAVKGNDANPGKSEVKAWKTLERANRVAFTAGDKLLLAGGQEFAGTLKMGKETQGTKEKTVIVSSFGQGRATINGGKGSAIQIEGCAFVQIRALNLVGCGRKDGNDGNGLEVFHSKNVSVDQVEVSGFRLSGIAGAAVTDMRITHVDAHDNGFAGISGGCCGSIGGTKNLYIGHCVAHDNPGDPKNLTDHSGNGIIIAYSSDALIEYCEVYNNGWDMPRTGNGPVGIWAITTRNLVVQFCISHDNKTPKGAMDGGGFDFDGGMTDSIFQYNLSYNNCGPGYLFCQYGGAPAWNNNTCRYNISINDGLSNQGAGISFFALCGNSSVSVYNNLVVNSKHAVHNAGDVNCVFRNNIFISDGDTIDGALGKKPRFEGNFYGLPKGAGVFRNGGTVFKTLEEWDAAMNQETIGGKQVGLSGDPKVSLPAKLEDLPKDPKELAKLVFGLPQSGSPCVGSGVTVPGNGGRDFWGNPVPEKGPRNIGPYEGLPLGGRSENE